MGLIDADRLRHEPVGSRNQLTLATRAVQVPSLKAGGLVRSMLCVTLCAVVVQASMNLAMNLQLPVSKVPMFENYRFQREAQRSLQRIEHLQGATPSSVVTRT